MKLVSISISNFRCYKDEATIFFEDLTAFVGKNDIGKSSILEALDIFFNDGKGIIKLEKGDINQQNAAIGNTEITISACFSELPDSIIIDATNETSLISEFMLNADSHLEIVKKYPNAGNAKVFIRAKHPNNPDCCDLLQKKDTELRNILERKAIACDDKTRNASMRAAIWNYFSDNLQLEIRDIEISKGDTKAIWDKLQSYLPIYSLFQSDRKNSDSDSEVQDPLKEAVRQILGGVEMQQQLATIADEVTRKLSDVAARTLSKLNEMNPEIANSLRPTIPAASALKWPEVFKNVSITGDDDIPINKRGSGVRRLILLNFFRAEAERKMEGLDNDSIIYAIEEPETSQHAESQIALVRALLGLASQDNTQVILTTHSAQAVKALGFANLRIVKSQNNIKDIKPAIPECLPSMSYNEVNFIAFDDATEEYHNELYGFIEERGQLQCFFSTQPKQSYVRDLGGGRTLQEQKTLTEYIRHQIHHPENTLNPHFSSIELRSSIVLMRGFIQQTGLR